MGIPALPICQITLKASKPNEKPYPKQLITIGDYIKKRRLDLNFTQRDIAKLIGVKEESVYNWENNRSNPKVYLLPKITEFLGYVPFEPPNETIGYKIKSYRKEYGLSQRRLAKLWGVDQTTIRDWENGKHKPIEKMKKKVTELLLKN